MSTTTESPALAGPIGDDCCIQGVKHTGVAVGKTVTIADVETYVSEPPLGTTGRKKVILFLADIHGPFFNNAKLIQDYFASHGFYVLGLDYFFGDTIDLHFGKIDFNKETWFAKSKAQADDAVPKWLKAVREIYGADAIYNAVGYCFGARYAVDLAATDDITAAAFAHPAKISEDQFKAIKHPFFLSCAEHDHAFPPPLRHRAEELLSEIKATFQVQLFSGVSHGFATRGNPEIENERWAKEDSARGIVEWFKRFSK